MCSQTHTHKCIYVTSVYFSQHWGPLTVFGKFPTLSIAASRCRSWKRPRHIPSQLDAPLPNLELQMWRYALGGCNGTFQGESQLQGQWKCPLQSADTETTRWLLGHGFLGLVLVATQTSLCLCFQTGLCSLPEDSTLQYVCLFVFVTRVNFYCSHLRASAACCMCYTTVPWVQCQMWPWKAHEKTVQKILQTSYRMPGSWLRC